MKLLVVAVCGALVGSAGASAQELPLRPMRMPPYVNDSGFNVLSYRAQAKGAGCEGAQAYQHPKEATNKGVSRLVWASAEKVQGGVACRGGQWHYGNGPNMGQPGGKVGDIFIKGGKYYWIAGR